MSLKDIGTDPSTWTPSDYAYIVAAFGIAVTIGICVFNRRCAKRDIRQKEILQQLKDLSQAASDATDAVAIHITWDAGRKSKSVVYSLIRKAMTQSETIQSMLPSVSSELFRHCCDWHTSVTAHFPVDTKAKAFKTNGAEVQNVRSGMKSYSEFLNQLIAKCVKGTLKI